MQNKSEANININKVFMISKYFFLVTLFLFLNSIALQSFNSTTSLYVVSLGGTASSAGLMLTCFTIAAMILRFAGNVVDRYGRLKVIAIGAALFALGSALFLFQKVSLLFVGRFFQGLGYSLSSTGIGVAIADVLPKPRMNEGIGYHNVAQTLGYTLGPSIALMLCNQGKGPFHWMILMGVIFSGLIVAVIPFCHYERDEVFQARKAAAEGNTEVREADTASGAAEMEKGISRIIEKSVLLVVLPNIMYSLTSAASVTCLALHATAIGIRNISLYFLLNAISTVVTRMTLGKILGRLRNATTASLGMLFMGAGFVLITISGTAPVLFYCAGVLIGIGACMASPAVHAEVIRWAPMHRRGVAMATYLISIDITMGVGGYLWGLVADLTGTFVPIFAACAAICAAGAAMAFVIFGRDPKHS